MPCPSSHSRQKNCPADLSCQKLSSQPEFRSVAALHANSEKLFPFASFSIASSCALPLRSIPRLQRQLRQRKPPFKLHIHARL